MMCLGLIAAFLVFLLIFLLVFMLVSPENRKYNLFATVIGEFVQGFYRLLSCFYFS